MIYLISQITFKFLTQIYYNMNFIASSSIYYRFLWHFEFNLRRLLPEDFFCGTQKCIFLNNYAKLVLKN